MKKVLSVVLSAIGFGVIAGLVIVGINFASREILPTQQPQTTVIEEESTVQNIAPETQAVAPSTNYIYNSNQRYTSVVDLTTAAMPSIVAVTNVQKYIQNGYSIFGFRSQQREVEVPASGSGVIVGVTPDEIIIVTNNHVVESSSSLSVTFQDGGEAVEANIKGTDSAKDLAVISVSKDKLAKDLASNVKAIKLGDSDKIKVGEQVVAIGNALGIGQSVTSGIVSAKDRVIDEINDSEKLIQTDAAINPGNSGGALLNMNGELIGINVAKSAGTAIEGMGYAIPINTAKDVIDTMSSKKSREKVDEKDQGAIGIVGRNIDSQTAESLGMPVGIYVFKISEGGAAAASDMKEKDIIVAVDDQSVETLAQVQDLLKYMKVGQEIKIKVKRLEGGNYVEKEFMLTLGKKEAQDEVPTPSEGSKQSNGQNVDPFGDDFFNKFFGGSPFGW